MSWVNGDHTSTGPYDRWPEKIHLPDLDRPQPVKTYRLYLARQRRGLHGLLRSRDCR